NLYDVYIIADSFQPQTIAQLRQLPIQVLEVSFEKSTKSKALNHAFGSIIKLYDIALICDADNILAKDFLGRINTAFVAGARAVQGRRVAKNLDSAFAVLDACSEGINNNIFRKGANAMGLSSSVIGSGMAFEYANLKQVMAGIEAVGGFDKIMQLKIVEQGISIRYLEDAIVFDEKVESSQAFQQQRKRWVSSQFIYLKKYFEPACKQLLKGNLSYFNLAVANNLVLPRAFLLIILPALIVTGFLLHAAWGGASIILLLMYLLCLFIALPTELINKDLWAALNKLPGAIMVMAGTLFGMKKANKTFIHTIHTKTEINNPSFNEHSH
ncbi:MAG: glycosyltransferase, partial [Bacteroidota bacterium]